MDPRKVDRRARHARANDPLRRDQFAPLRERHPVWLDPVDLPATLPARDQVDDERCAKRRVAWFETSAMAK
jgi:hypothetical protein